MLNPPARFTCLCGRDFVVKSATDIVGKMLDWRKVETALSQVIRSYGFELDQRSDSGDIRTANAIHYRNGMNLTALAKDLAKELER